MRDALDREVVIKHFLSSNRFNDAEAFALTIEPEWEQAEPLAYIARAAWKAHDPERAWRVWSTAAEVAKRGERSESTQDSLDSSSVLWEIAENRAVSGDIEQARYLALTIQNEGKKVRAIECVEAIASGAMGSFEF